jgi:2-keto-4-pentenoate hydratase/2-oxohepta-3-ene-1,7-dioic acid hydratase in catechol pathway
VKVARVDLADGRVVVAEVTEDGYRPVIADAPGAVLGVLTDGTSADEAIVPAAEVTVLNPLPDPPSVRDFMIFEDHVRNARVGTGTEVPKAWYAAPVFYFTNPAALVGPGEPVAVPTGCRALDFELEVACVIGQEASNLDPEDPASCDVIAGFLLMNDWSARDLQMREMDAGLGPAKGKDFATSLGPWVVTPDELASGPGRFACPLEVRVNGERKGGGDLADAHWTWSQVLGHASANTRLRPGDVIGSGTVGTGCLLELRALGPKDDHPWLQPGDEVTLDGGPLGTLTNPIA